MKEAIQKRSIPEPNSGCWIWERGVDTYGYGHFWVSGKLRLAHRISYSTHVGEIPSGLHVLHRCDNPSCVNPEHLFCGTHADNMRDREKKGRGTLSRPEMRAKQISSIRERPKFNPTGFPCVRRLSKSRFDARVYVNGKRIWLGSFESAEDAGRAVEEALRWQP